MNCLGVLFCVGSDFKVSAHSNDYQTNAKLEIALQTLLLIIW